MTKKYLLLYDHEEELYRGFISSYFTNLPTAGGNGDDNGSGGNDSGSSGGNDDSGEEDNEEEEEEDAYRTCGVCHGSGKCNKCGGVFDVKIPYMKDLDIQASQMTGFTLYSHNTTFTGICDKCKSS